MAMPARMSLPSRSEEALLKVIATLRFPSHRISIQSYSLGSRERKSFECNAITWNGDTFSLKEAQYFPFYSLVVVFFSVGFYEPFLFQWNLKRISWWDVFLNNLLHSAQWTPLSCCISSISIWSFSSAALTILINTGCCFNRQTINFLNIILFRLWIYLKTCDIL